MSGPARARWPSRVGWTFAIAFFFALQFGAVLWLARPPSPSPPVVHSSPTARLWIPRDPVEEQSLPGRFRLPTAAGREALSFSRAAEQALPKPQYQLDELAATPRWLAVEAGVQLASPVAPVRLPALPRTPDSLPDSATRPVTAGAMATQTVVAVKGDLAQRRWESPARWPVWTNAEPLRPTIIEVAVTPRGDVLVPTLLASSGDKAADSSALESIRRARFQPLAGATGDALTWGKLVVQWVTVPPLSAGTLR